MSLHQIDLTEALQLLNAKEANRDGRWQTDDREMTSAVKFLDAGGTLGVSRLEPDTVGGSFEQLVCARGKYLKWFQDFRIRQD